MGKAAKKRKYAVLTICAAKMKGSSAGQLPNQVRSRKVLTSDQNMNCFTGHQVQPTILFLFSVMGRVANTRIAINKATTPPSLLGTERRIA